MVHNEQHTVDLPCMSTVIIPVYKSGIQANKSCMNNREALIAYIKRRMEALGYNQSSLSIKAGYDKDTLRNFFEGKAQDLKAEKYNKIMDLIKEAKVPIVGYAGAGERVYFFDDEHNLEMIDRLPEAPEIDIVALVVRGESMLPVLEPGCVVFYTRDSEGVPSDCIGRMCVVRLEDDSTLVKKVRNGSKDGLFHLISHNAEPLVDQKIVWAARVLYTKYT